MASTNNNHWNTKLSCSRFFLSGLFHNSAASCLPLPTAFAKEDICGLLRLIVCFKSSKTSYAALRFLLSQTLMQPSSYTSSYTPMRQKRVSVTHRCNSKPAEPSHRLFQWKALQCTPALQHIWRRVLRCHPSNKTLATLSLQSRVCSLYRSWCLKTSQYSRESFRVTRFLD